jgi:hypothetical protein
MKNPHLSSLIVIGLVMFNISLYSQEIKQRAKTGISYVESSNGMAIPAWEGGRTELEFADIDQDGNVDIITIGDHGSPGINTDEHGIMVYFGDGQGNWNVQMTGDLGYGGIAAGDVNNDGFIDVGYGMHHNYSGTDLGNQILEVALGNGTGTAWTPWDDGLATNGEDWGMFGTDFADVDNDGDLDVGSISFGCCAGLHIYLNNLDGTWTQSWGVLENNSDMIFQFGDIDNDGAMDFVAGYEMGTAYFGDGEGGFAVNDQGLPSGGYLGQSGPSLGDVDGNGGMDLAFCNSSGGVQVYTFSEMLNSWVNFSGTLPASGSYEQTQLSDMNSDGFMDVAAYGNGTFQLFLGDGSGNWTADATFTTGDPGSAQAFRVGGDIDHNGRPDIVLLEEEELSWFTYQNYLKCYKESSVPILLSVQPVYPHGKELFRPGSVHFIDWMSTVPGSGQTVTHVTLEYSVDGSTGPWTLIASGLPDNGRYQWIVPQENSADCYIRYNVSDGVTAYSSTTPAAFVITDGTIGLPEPITNENLQLFPNPAGRQLTVDGRQSAVGGQRLDLKICILDMQGRVVKEYSGIPSLPYTLDISTLDQGLYILRMKNYDGTSSSTQFIKISR